MVENSKKRITIQDLYPDFSPEEQAEAEANLKAYMNLVWRIYTRLKREGIYESEIEKLRLREEWEKRYKED